ncbi:MAG TPA: BON domain-containing protein [Verrucomicrobiae bacterium]|nr:BON domain-containing protein [Verrucomicrobiae bacterium]
MRTFKDVILVTGLTGVVALTSLTGCSMWEGKKARETGRTLNQYQSDKATSDRVADALKAAPVYKFPDVQVQTFNANVQLSGFVHTQGQKEQAEKIAKQTPGVAKVIDDLAVVPEGPTPTGQTRGYPQIEETHKVPNGQAPANQQTAPVQQAPNDQNGSVNTAPNNGPATR